MKRKVFLKVLMLVLLTSSIFLINAHAASSGSCGTSTTWEFNETTGKLVISGTGQITSISWSDISNNITEVVIKEGVTNTPSGAFSNCVNLKTVTIPSTLTSIGTYSFNNCNIEKVYISSIEAWLKISYSSSSYSETNPLRGADLYLNGNKVTNLVIPSGVTKISNYSFYGCKSIETISFSSTVTEIGNYAFFECSGLREVELNEGLTKICTSAFKNCSALEKASFPISLKTIESSAFDSCVNLNKVYIKDFASWNNVNMNSTGVPMLYGANLYVNGTLLEEIEISKISTTNSFPLRGCTSIKKVVLKNINTTMIPGYYFSGCKNLKEIVLDEKIKEIGKYAFANCERLEYITLGANVETIGSNVFENCKSLTSISIPSKIKSLPGFVFAGCSELKTVTIHPECTITTIGSAAFKDCKELSDITIPETITSIPNNAFYGCESLTGINIPAGITQIVGNPFGKCTNLSKFDVSQDNTKFVVDEYGALYDIDKTRLISLAHGKNLTSYTLPASVTSIEPEAFGINIEEIFVDKSNANFQNDDFGVLYTSGFAKLVCYPAVAKMQAYSIHEKATGVGSLAFYGAKNLHEIYIPSTVSSISSDAFNETKDTLVFYVTPNSFAETFVIRNKYTYSYGGLCGTNITWKYNENTITISGTGAMHSYSTKSPAPWSYLKDNIVRVVLEEGITHIGAYAFNDCNNVSEIIFPNGLESIGSYAFQNCTGLTQVYLPNTITELNSPFYGCSNLKRIDISDSEAFFKIKPSQFFVNTDVQLFDNDKLVTDVILYYNNPELLSNYGFIKTITVAEGVTKIESMYNITAEKIILSSTVESVYNLAVVKEFIVNENNKAFCSIEGVLYSKDMTKLVAYPTKKEDLLFVIPESVKTVGTFNKNSFIREVTVHGGVQNLNACFSGCSNLEKINLSEGLTEFTDTLTRTKVSKLFLPSTVKVISIDVGENMVIQGYNDTYAQSYALTNNITFESLGEPPEFLDYGYFGNGLKWKISEKFNLYISGEGAMPNYSSPAETPWYNYMGMVKNIKIEDGVTAIGSNCFKDIPSVEMVIIPSTVSTIENNAFDKDSDFSIYGFANSEANTYANNISIRFVEIVGTGKAGVALDWLVTSDNVLEFYGYGEMFTWSNKKSVPWCSYKATICDIIIPDGVKNIPSWTFVDCTSLRSLVIPDSVEVINDYALQGCTSLEELTLPFIGKKRGGEYDEHAVFGSIFGFIGVGGGVSFEDGVVQRFDEVKGDKGLYGAFIPASLKKVIITDEEFIPYGAFSNCSLNEVVIPKDVKYISSYAFYNTTTHATTKVTYPGTAKAWERLNIGEHNSIEANITGENLIAPEPVIEIYDVLGGKKIKITGNEKARIYYTLDGANPSHNSNEYTSELLLDKVGEYEIKAIAIMSGYDESYIVSEKIKLLQASMPVASLGSGLVKKGTPVELYSELEGAKILYTLDNSVPDKFGNVYSEPIVIDGFVWVKAIAVKEGYADSNIAIYNYTDEYAIPDILTKEATLVSKHSAVLNANVINEHELGFFDVEFVIYEKNNPENVSRFILNGDWCALIEDLREDTEYCYFIRVTNGDKTSEGNIAEFKTKTYEIPMNIVLSHDGFRLQNGRSYVLKAIVLPETALNKELVWTSSNPAVATVDENGVIRAKSNGRVTITATSVESGVSSSCEVVVYNKYVTEAVDISELNMYTNIREFAEHGFEYDSTNIEGACNYHMLAYMSNWDGAVTEMRDRYFAADAGSAYGYVLEDYYNELSPDYHVQNVYILPIRENSYDNDELKRAIKKYGAVAAVMYVDYTDPIYGITGDSYYYDYGWNWSTGNHLVTLVGWDDNYPATNFRIRPEGNGAFIVKNSWGTTTLWGNEAGDDGYFYISYYDTILARYTNSYVYPELETNNNYNNIWQYDYTGPSYKLGYENTIYAANVFPQDGRALANDELLRAVSFHTAAQDMGYEIYVVDDFVDEASLVINSTPVKTGTIHEMGYHTIELDEYIKLDAGKRFAVIVRLIRDDAIANMYVEKLWARNIKMEHFDNVGFYSSDGKHWSEVDSKTNVCIKAFTDFADINKAERSVYKSNETIEVSPVSIDLCEADSSFSLKPYHFGGLYPDLQDTMINNFISDIDLPDKYDLRELGFVTPIKDQGGFGMCAAFGAAASIESCVLKRIVEGPLTSGDNNAPNEVNYGSITYSNGKIYVNSPIEATLYVATYDSDRLKDVVVYPINAGVETIVPFEYDSMCKAFLWDEKFRPLCNAFLSSLYR